MKTAVAPNQFSEVYERFLKAAAIAHRETRVPITTHVWGDRPGSGPVLKLIELLQKNDVDPGKFYMSHIEWTEGQEKNWGVAVRAAASGIYLSFDNFGKEFPYGSMDNTFDDYGYIGAPTDLTRTTTDQNIDSQEGYEDKIVVGHDSAYKVQKLSLRRTLCHIRKRPDALRTQRPRSKILQEDRCGQPAKAVWLAVFIASLNWRADLYPFDSTGSVIEDEGPVSRTRRSELFRSRLLKTPQPALLCHFADQTTMP